MHIAALTPFNTPGGISIYSASLYAAIEDSGHQVSIIANRDIDTLTNRDKSNVYRLWINQGNDFGLVTAWMNKRKPDIVHIQLHPQYLPPKALGSLLQILGNQKVVVTMHSFGSRQTEYAKLLSQPQVKAVILHQLSSNFTANNVDIIPLGYDDYPALDKQALRTALGIADRSPIIVTHGLITPGKGLLETAAAIKDLVSDFPNLIWIAANAVGANASSQQIKKQLVSEIAKLQLQKHVELITSYPTDLQVVSLIQAADIGLMPYAEVGEGASAAVRKFISCNVPTIVTDIPVMHEFQAEVFKISDNQPSTIAAGIKQLWQDKNLRTQLMQAEAKRKSAQSWDKIAAKLISIYNQI